MLQRLVDEDFKLFLVRQIADTTLGYLFGSFFLLMFVLDLPKPLVNLVFLHT